MCRHICAFPFSDHSLSWEMVRLIGSLQRKGSCAFQPVEKILYKHNWRCPSMSGLCWHVISSVTPYSQKTNFCQLSLAAHLRMIPQLAKKAAPAARGTTGPPGVGDFRGEPLTKYDSWWRLGDVVWIQLKKMDGKCVALRFSVFSNASNLWVTRHFHN